MKRSALVILFVLFFVWSLAATAEPIKGVVKNMTTNKLAAGDTVTLKSAASGAMADVGSTKTNAKGEFSFNAQPTQMPYIIWVQHQNVLYTHLAMPGPNVISVEVFDATPTLKEVALQEHLIVMRTDAAAPDVLKVDELFTMNNTSDPPRTLLAPHTLEIYLPENVKIEETSAQPARNRSIKAALVPTEEKNKYAFGFPVRPGQTQYRVTYSLPYTGKLKIDSRIAMPAGSTMVVTPHSYTFTPADSSIYQPSTEPPVKGVNVYVAKNTMPQQKLGFEIAGTGDLPREQEAPPPTQGGAGSGRPENSGPGGGLGLPNERPDPLHSGQWLFLGVLTLFLAAGALYVYTANQEPLLASNSGQRPMDRSEMLLEAMKEEVFQLESDRLQGKISPQDYQTAKAALDKTLQRAVQRQSPAAK